MTPILAVLGIAVCVALGVVVRCGRDVAVLRRLDRLMDGCDQRQRVEVCRILAASLREAGRSDSPDAVPANDRADAG